MLNILVIGGSGQIGSHLRSEKKRNDFNYLFPSSSELNITKKKSINSFLDSKKLDLIINFGAYTNVDKAELEKKRANQVNNIGVSNLSYIANLKKIKVIHFSTDYVFGKDQIGIRKSTDRHSPINYYGLTKSLGENSVLRNSESNTIIRLASVCGEFGNNFIKTILRLILSKSEIQVINDQKISITNSKDVVHNIPYLIEFLNENNNMINKNRVYNFTNKGYTNWFSVAKLIKKEVEIILNKKIVCQIVPIKASEWVSLANRPLDSRLKVDFKKFEENNIFIRRWDVSVKETVKNLLPNMINEIKNGK